jgi:hypothetical protein
LIQLGKVASEPAAAEQPGVWIRGDVDVLVLTTGLRSMHADAMDRARAMHSPGCN